MAIIHKATLTPSKLDLLTSYLGNDPQLSRHTAGGITAVGAYRFDDPAGDVGIESHLLRAATGSLLHLPVVYRNEQWAGADQWFLGTMEHSVLGERWVYEASVDPIYVRELVRTVLFAGTGVDEMVETPDGPVAREPSVRVLGSGRPQPSIPEIDQVIAERLGGRTRITCGELTVVVNNVLDATATDGPRLTGTWLAQTEPIELATVHS